MANASYKLQVNWSNDGDFLDTGEDIATNRIRRISCRRGRDQASQLTGQSVGGQLTAIIDNRSGDYNPSNTGQSRAGDYTAVS